MRIKGSNTNEEKSKEMKKRTKITLRTKIYLTIVGLLALTGVLYAQFPPSHPTPLTAGVPFPTGVAASPDMLLVSEYCSENIDQYDCATGNVTLFAQTPGFGSCREKYMTIAPSQSANAGFTPRDVFVTEGALVFKIHERCRLAVCDDRGVPRIGPQRDYV